MKRKAVIILGLIIFALLSACGGSTSNPNAGPSQTPSVAQVEDKYIAPIQTLMPISTLTPVPTPTPAPTATLTPTPEPTLGNDFEWIYFTDTVTDSNGYTVEISYKLSPWILTTNTELVDLAWAEVGDGSVAPEFMDWGLPKMHSGFYGDYYYAHVGPYNNEFVQFMTDMYYCFGTFQIENKTAGWSFSSENPYNLRSVSLRWNCDLASNSIDRAFSYGTAIGRVYFSNGYSDYLDGISPSFNISSDHPRPVPFIIMAPEFFSPNYPGGMNIDAMREGHMTAHNTDFYMGVFGKDGEYIPPVSND